MTTIPADGDCFYAALVLAQTEIAGSSSCSSSDPDGIIALREIVADQVDDQTLIIMRECRLAGIDGYEYMDAVHTTADLQEALRRCGRGRGPGGCVWADTFAVQTLANYLHLTVLIIDEETPRRGSSRGGGGVGCDGFVAIQPELLNPQSTVGAGGALRGSCAGMAIILVRSRREHYSLIRINGRCATAMDRLVQIPPARCHLMTHFASGVLLPTRRHSASLASPALAGSGALAVV